MRNIEKIIQDSKDGKVHNLVFIAEYKNNDLKIVEIQTDEKSFEKFAEKTFDHIQNSGKKFDKSFIKKIINHAKSELICKCIRDSEEKSGCKCENG